MRTDSLTFRLNRVSKRMGWALAPDGARVTLAWKFKTASKRFDLGHCDPVPIILSLPSLASSGRALVRFWLPHELSFDVSHSPGQLVRILVRSTPSLIGRIVIPPGSPQSQWEQISTQFFQSLSKIGRTEGAAFVLFGKDASGRLFVRELAKSGTGGIEVYACPTHFWLECSYASYVGAVRALVEKLIAALGAPSSEMLANSEFREALRMVGLTITRPPSSHPRDRT